MKKVFSRTRTLRGIRTHYCPGCGHGIAHRLVAEVIDELGIRERTIGVAPVGCAVIAYYYWDIDMCEAPHGRPPAVATGIKSVRPENIVFTYQGDGDLAAIGFNETIHTANRGENITVIFINNAVYGMTGGQMAPTTLCGQITATTPSGRDVRRYGEPIRVAELLAGLQGVCFSSRVGMYDVPSILKTKQAVKKAFQMQIEGKGFSIVEILSTCPTYWGKSPGEAMEFIKNEMTKVFPLGVFKEKNKNLFSNPPEKNKPADKTQNISQPA